MTSKISYCSGWSVWCYISYIKILVPRNSCPWMSEWTVPWRRLNSLNMLRNQMQTRGCAEIEVTSQEIQDSDKPKWNQKGSSKPETRCSNVQVGQAESLLKISETDQVLCLVCLDPFVSLCIPPFHHVWIICVFRSMFSLMFLASACFCSLHFRVNCVHLHSILSARQLLGTSPPSNSVSFHGAFPSLGLYIGE